MLIIDQKRVFSFLIGEVGGLFSLFAEVVVTALITDFSDSTCMKLLKQPGV